MGRRGTKVHAVSRALARAFLAEWPDPERMLDRAGAAVGYRWTFLQDLVDRLLAGPHPTLRRLAGLIAADRGLRAAWERKEEDLEETDREALGLGFRLEVHAIAVVPSRMTSSRWPMPSIVSDAELGALLGLSPRELEQLAGHGSRDRRVPPGPLRNYSYQWRGKPGGASPRLIEAPKRRLKRAQRRIAETILRPIPVDPACHGFVRGRSTLTHAGGHAGKAIVVRLDLREFFPSISGGRVMALFRTAGYPEPIARLLAALTTNAVPQDVLRAPGAAGLDGWARALLRGRHLPQGAPSSPAIANLCAFRLDRRLAGLARSFGLHYSRYADDLVFSGRPEAGAVIGRFIELATAVAAEEGFRVHQAKTRIMRPGVRQVVAGLVVNRHPNVARADYERLKAILHNAARFGPATQNREGHADFRAHLEGKVAYLAMVHPARGARLRAALGQIRWD